MKLLLALIGTAALCVGFFLFLSYVLASGPDEPDEPIGVSNDTPPEVAAEWIMAEIDHRIDIEDANTLHLEVRVHPGAEFPGITGDYIETRVECFVRIRGISVPTMLRTPLSRYGKSFEEIRRERERCEETIDHIWNLLKVHKKLQLSNPEVIKEDGKIIVVCDVAFFLGDAWHLLSVALIADEFAREAVEGVTWHWGSKNVKPLN